MLSEIHDILFRNIKRLMEYPKSDSMSFCNRKSFTLTQLVNTNNTHLKSIWFEQKS